MPGSSRLPVSLRETFIATKSSVRGQQLAVFNADLYVESTALYEYKYCDERCGADWTQHSV
jgi:hypothetical protein